LKLEVAVVEEEVLQLVALVVEGGEVATVEVVEVEGGEEVEGVEVEEVEVEVDLVVEEEVEDMVDTASSHTCSVFILKTELLQMNMIFSMIYIY
jgi:hypothetical protein